METRQPINLSLIFARHWHHISICFKPFHVNQQARCLEFFKSTSPMILCSSFNGLMAESYLLCLFCFAMVCRWTVRHSTVCPRPLPAKSLLSLLPVPWYWISWLVVGFTTSAPPEMVRVAGDQRFQRRISICTFPVFSPLSWINLNGARKAPGVQQQTAWIFSFYGIFNTRLDDSNSCWEF